MKGEIRVFSTPQEAVDTVNRLLRNEDWWGLLSCYVTPPLAASASEEDARAFFMDDSLQGQGHPAGFSRYRRPFPAGFEYRGHRQVGEGLCEVEVMIRIAQGEGVPDQVGLATFLLAEVKEGYALTLDD